MHPHEQARLRLDCLRLADDVATEEGVETMTTDAIADAIVRRVIDGQIIE